jgi:tRNA pseudouridine38-40 synthase
MKRFLVGVQYNGSRYSGWSQQEPCRRGVPAGLVYQLIHRLNQFMIKKFDRVIGSSRTDAGVHAIRNCFQIDIKTDEFSPNLTPEKFIRGLNSYLLKDDIHILDSREVPLTFDCRKNATSRTYMYRLMTSSKDLKLPKQWLFQDPNVWYVKQLDIAAMREAAQHFIGIHDFTTFRNRDCQSRSTHRHLWRLDIDQYNCENSLIHDPFLLVCIPLSLLLISLQGPNNLITITITGNAFLYRMVRNMVGTLVAVGQGKMSPDDIPKLLEARDRLLLPPLAPPHGLFLVDVTYNEEDMIISQ